MPVPIHRSWIYHGRDSVLIYRWDRVLLCFLGPVPMRTCEGVLICGRGLVCGRGTGEDV